MKHTLRVMDYSGDTVIAEWRVDEAKEVADAAETFLQRRGRYLAYTDTTPAEQVAEFRPDVDIIMSPALQGG